LSAVKWERPIRFLIVDDDKSFIDLFCRRLQDFGLEVGGVAHSEAEAIQEAQRLSCDIFLVDLELAGADAAGIRLIPKLRSEQSGAKVAVLTQWINTNNALLKRARDQHPDGFFSKHDPIGDIVGGIREVVYGSGWFVSANMALSVGENRPYSAWDDMTAEQRTFLRNYASEGRKPEGFRSRTGMSRPNFQRYIEVIRPKIIREMEALNDEVPRDLDSVQILIWARDHLYHYR
jgi:DNA-binding NarL/FixJ family response regulator